MTFDLRKIGYFLAVMEHRTISGAAEALRVSQPTLSRQIHILERQFRARLFIRHGRGVLPTEAGKRLHEGLRGLKHQLRVLQDDVATAADEPSGQVALGIPPSPRSLFAATLVSRFCAAYPKVALRLCEQTSGDVRDLVARGEIDLGIVPECEPMHGIAFDRLVTEPMLLVGPRAAGLSLDASTPLAKLAELPLILTTAPNSLRRMVEREFDAMGLRPRIKVEANTLPLMTDLVARGLGYTLLPSCSVLALTESGSLSASRVATLSITWTVARPANRSLSVAASSLFGSICEIVSEIAGTPAWPLAQLESDCMRSTRKLAGRTATPSRADRRANR